MSKVSVIIPTINRATILLETLHSVLAQTYTNKEVIVVNDGSTDGNKTRDALAPYVERGQILYIEQSNQGLSMARNNGLKEATGDYVCFLDDDDLWPEDKLEWQVNAFKNGPADAVLVYGYAVHFGEGYEAPPPETERPSGKVLYAFCSKCYMFSIGQVMIPTPLLKEMGGFDPDIYGVQDWDLYLRLAQRGSFVYEKRQAIHYRVHPTSMSRQGGKMFAGMEQMVKKHTMANPDKEMVRLLREYISIGAFEYTRTADYEFIQMEKRAIDLKDAGKRSAALHLMFQAALTSPDLWRVRRFRHLFLATLLPSGVKQMLARRSA